MNAASKNLSEVQTVALATIVRNARSSLGRLTADMTNAERRQSLATYVGENSSSGISRPTARALVRARLAQFVGSTCSAILPTREALCHGPASRIYT